MAATKLAWWRKEVAAAYAGQPSHPVMKALLPLAPEFGIEAGHLQAVIDGCQMDLEQTRFLDFAGLSRYCHLVAGVVGEVAANIFGRSEADTVRYAHKLGLAMQLTNIIRDVGDDARRGRIYLPVSELQRFDVKASEILQRAKPWGYSDRFTALMKFQAERAHATYDEALALLPEADRAAQKPGLMMANIYRTLLREIEARGLPGAAPAHLADAAAQALDRHAHALARPLMAAAVAVVGAGWAGLAAAVRAREAGHAVTLFEMAAQLGGRARSVDIEGHALDNGQHILIGAYQRTLALMRTVGADPQALLTRLPLTLLYPDGRGLRLPPGPALPGFVRGVLSLPRLDLGATAWPCSRPPRAGCCAAFGATPRSPSTCCAATCRPACARC